MARQRKPAKRTRVRRLFMKFRVIPLRRMPKSELFRRLKESIDTGVVADDIEILGMDWGHGRGIRARSGYAFTTDELAEMTKFYQVLSAVPDSRVRFEST